MIINKHILTLFLVRVFKFVSLNLIDVKIKKNKKVGVFTKSIVMVCRVIENTNTF